MILGDALPLSIASKVLSKDNSKKSPQKMEVMWNLLIAVAYDNIGIFLHTGFYVP
jgi:hypothetical protein